MKPTLVVMAAGMGSRYGGLKQLDPLGPNGETIMDYSIYDAHKAGFGKVVFVIRHFFEEQFREQVLKKYDTLIDTEIVFQEVDALPQPFICPQERTKPWGTNHALMMTEKVVHEPFAVINADDFYGRDAFVTMANYLQQLPAGSQNSYCMVAYELQNTMSASGTVSRGVCSVNENFMLTSIEEHKKIGFDNQKRIISQKDVLDENISLSPETPVSMNMWGFTPDYFSHSKELFIDFLTHRINESGSEFFIPSVVDHLIVTKQATVKVLKTSAQWFGVTYSEDRPQVVANLLSLVEQSIYPSPLFEIRK